MSDGKYRKSDKSYGYPAKRPCRFAHERTKGEGYRCFMRSFNENGERVFGRSQNCEEHRAMNIQNGFACENYRGRRSAHQICDKCLGDLHAIEDYRCHMDAFTVYECEWCGHKEEFT